jgi:hypothetical protein
LTWPPLRDLYDVIFTYLDKNPEINMEINKEINMDTVKHGDKQGDLWGLWGV